MAPSDSEDPNSSDLTVEAPGVDEVVVVPWPLIWRQRVGGRVARHDRYPWFVLTAALFGLFAVGFTITVLSNSINAIADDLESSPDTLTWVITGALLAYAVLGPAAGKLGDVLGSRRVYLWSLVGVALFAALTAVAWNATSLIAFRVLGAGVGAATGPASLAMINKLFSRERRAQALGYWALVGAGGPVVGVVIGGPVVEAYGWRWIFVAQVPLTILALAIGYVVLPDTDRRERTPFDVAGSVLVGSGVGSALVALNRGPILGWTHPVVVGGFVLAVLLGMAFVRVESRTDYPLVPLDYFARRNVAVPLMNQFFTNFAYMGGFIVTPLLLQDVLGYSETHSGLLSVARPLAFSIAGPVAGYVTVRSGERLSAVVGAALIVVSMLLLASVGVGTSDWLIVLALGVSGTGMGTSSPALATAIANEVDERDLGVIGATQQMVSQVGQVAGIQILLTVQAAVENTGTASSGYHAAYLVGAGAAGIGLVSAVFIRSG